MAQEQEIFGFIRRTKRYLDGMAERGDCEAAWLRDIAGLILEQHREEGEE